MEQAMKVNFNSLVCNSPSPPSHNKSCSSPNYKSNIYLHHGSYFYYHLESLIKFTITILNSTLNYVVIFSVENRRYFANFAASSGALVITDSDAILLTDFRYIEEAKHLTDNFEVKQHGSGDLIPSVIETLRQLSITSIGIEDSLSVG